MPNKDTRACTHTPACVGHSSLTRYNPSIQPTDTAGGKKKYPGSEKHTHTPDTHSLTGKPSISYQRSLESNPLEDIWTRGPKINCLQCQEAVPPHMWACVWLVKMLGRGPIAMSDRRVAFGRVCAATSHLQSWEIDEQGEGEECLSSLFLPPVPSYFISPRVSTGKLQSDDLRLFLFFLSLPLS